MAIIIIFLVHLNGIFVSWYEFSAVFFHSVHFLKTILAHIDYIVFSIQFILHLKYTLWDLSMIVQYKQFICNSLKLKASRMYSLIDSRSVCWFTVYFSDTAHLGVMVICRDIMFLCWKVWKLNAGTCFKFYWYWYIIGQPYNQLAILEASRGDKLSTVFYYIRSLAVRHPFPVAATNLEKFYSKLIKDTYVYYCLPTLVWGLLGVT